MAGSAVMTSLVGISADGRTGELRRPAGAGGFVIFAHGSGSSRFSRRNIAVAEHLAGAGIGSLLFDLLTPQEAEDRRKVFDIALLSGRVAEAIDWALAQPWSKEVGIGLFGASTGAAAALVAATMRPEAIRAVVSRGGRPDLAGAHLADVRAPTLLVVGGEDTEVLELNCAAARRLACPHRVVVVPGATHLFEEPGTLALAIGHAEAWFLNHLSKGRTSP